VEAPGADEESDGVVAVGGEPVLAEKARQLVPGPFGVVLGMLADGCPELVGYRVSETVAEQVAGGAKRVIPARPCRSDVLRGDGLCGVDEAEDQRESAEVVGGSAADRCDIADVVGEQGRSRPRRA
jgi:hypothetical protein